MFILEIAGKAVAITNADQDQAHELFMSEDFKDDLKSFSSEGKPLWDGSSLLTIRRATDDEIEAFDEAMEDDDDLDDERRTTRMASTSCSSPSSTRWTTIQTTRNLARDIPGACP